MHCRVMIQSSRQLEAMAVQSWNTFGHITTGLLQSHGIAIPQGCWG